MAGTLIVTGAGRGIGAAVARLAGRHGYAVAVNYFANAAAAEGVAQAISAAGGRAAAFQGDVSDPEDVERLFDGAVAALGPLAGLVNNAGVTGPVGPLAEVDDATLRQVIDIDVMGCLLCARAAVRRLSTACGGKGGAIVNVSSAAATLGSPGEFVWYAASKGAVDTLTVGLAREVGGAGIRVNGVAPGLIDTEIHAAAGIPDRMERLGPTVPMGRGGTPDEVAEAVLWLLSDAASYITGTTIRIAGGR